MVELGLDFDTDVEAFRQLAIQTEAGSIRNCLIVELIDHLFVGETLA